MASLDTAIKLESTWADRGGGESLPRDSGLRAQSSGRLSLLGVIRHQQGKNEERHRLRRANLPRSRALGESARTPQEATAGLIETLHYGNIRRFVPPRRGRLVASARQRRRPHPHWRKCGRIRKIMCGQPPRKPKRRFRSKRVSGSRRFGLDFTLAIKPSTSSRR